MLIYSMYSYILISWVIILILISLMIIFYLMFVQLPVDLKSALSILGEYPKDCDE